MPTAGVQLQTPFHTGRVMIRSLGTALGTLAARAHSPLRA